MLLNGCIFLCSDLAPLSSSFGICCVYCSYEVYVGSFWNVLPSSQQVLYLIINVA